MELPWAAECCQPRNVPVPQHANLFIPLGLSTEHIERSFVPQELNHADAAGRILDDDATDIPLARQRLNSIAHLEHGPMAARHVQEMDPLFVEAREAAYHDGSVVVA